MKKYLLVLSCMELGGSERQAINLAKYLQRIGREVTILGLAHPGMVCEICEKENIPWLMMPQGNVWLNKGLNFMDMCAHKICKRDIGMQILWLMHILAKYIKDNEYDICISYCTYANTVLGFSKKFYNGCTCVWFQRDAGISDCTSGYQRRAIQMADYVFANSQSGKDWIKKGYGMDAALVYNGVLLSKPQKSPDEWREILKVDHTDIICTMIANLSSAKDHISILRTWKLLYELKQDRNIILVFAGRFDDQYQQLYSYAAENSLLEHVRFLGQVTDISGLLGVTSICVFGAISEGSPNGIIEPAMAGLPVMATDLPEIREIVAEENYQYLFGRGDIERAANNILKLVENTELRRYLGQKNEEKAAKMFSYDDNFSKIVSIVEGSSQ